jgi:glycosyl transferase family 87
VTEARLLLYGYAIAVIYAAFLMSVYKAGTWITDGNAVPVYTDFTSQWVAAVLALHGQAASLADPAEFNRIQAAFVGPTEFFYPHWPYPPSFLLILAPFTVLPYILAFVGWDLATLLGSVVVVYAILRRPAATALALAWPYSAWNFLAAQNGFLTASLLGASLLFLERRPAFAGVFIGFLTYKPQFGLLFPVALLVAGQWRTIASAAITAAFLAGASVAAFGAGVWVAFPQQLLAQTGLNLLADSADNWGYVQTVYGLARSLHSGATIAWIAQGVTTFGTAIIVWFVWRAKVAFSLKAATLSAAALAATPCAFAYDLAAMAIPAAFFMRDQLDRGLLKGEQIVMAGLFGALVAALLVFKDPPVGVTFGGLPIGPIALIAVLGLIFRRALYHRSSPSSLAASAV